MKKTVSIFMLFFLLACGMAQASHHRGHALMHLDNATLRLGQSIDFAAIYRDKYAAALLPADQKAAYDALETEAAIAGWLAVQRATYPKVDYPEWNVAYDHIFLSNKYVLYGNKYLNRTIAARDLLANGGDLDESRRLLNAPGMGSELESAVWGTIQLQANMYAAIRADSPHLAMVAKVLQLNRMASGSLTYAIWHNNDAIREEVYTDPAFICSGPGSHCE